MCEKRVLRLVAVVTTSALLATVAHAVTIETVPVGNTGNAPDTRYEAQGFGAVNYTYRIGKYEVTAGQYTEFLNAVAATDTYGLYDERMFTSAYGCKVWRTGMLGSYEYVVDADGDGAEDPNWVNRPANFVDWGDAARFANWLHNGEPTGAQDLSTTEDGSYYLNGATSAAALLEVTRKPGATWVIPTEDEWYKAAYYDPAKPGGAGYWEYSTQSDDPNVPSNELVEPNDLGNNATFWVGDPGEWPDPNGFTIGGPYYRTEVGAHEQSDSAYGTFDQSGNVWEWNETKVTSIFGATRRLRGGSFGSWVGSISASSWGGASPHHSEFAGGFRVAMIPEPSTVVSGMVGLLCVFWWRRRVG